MNRPNRVSLSLSILDLARYRANVWCDGWNSCNWPLLYLEWVMALSLSLSLSPVDVYMRREAVSVFI